MNKVTVLIPVHDPDGKYESFLIEALESIKNQDRTPDEVLLVANHLIPYLDHLKGLMGGEIELRFQKSSATSASGNINFGVEVATGELVRLLFQDDVLVGSGSLSSSLELLENRNSTWSVIGSQDWDDSSGKKLGKRYPKFSESLKSGINRIGAPSVVCFSKSKYMPMNTDLKYMFDCDWYLKMAHRNGIPVQINTIGVGIRVHEGQATQWAKLLLKKEKKVVRALHRKKVIFNNFSAKIYCNCSDKKMEPDSL